MKNLKSIRIKIEKPNLQQRFVVVTANFLLWLIIILFKDDEDRMEYEIKDVLKSAYKAILDLNN